MYQLQHHWPTVVLHSKFKTPTTSCLFNLQVSNRKLDSGKAEDDFFLDFQCCPLME